MNAQSLPGDLVTRRGRRSLAIGATFLLLATLAALVAFVPHMGLVAVSAVYLGAFLGYLGLRPRGRGGDLFEVIIPLSAISWLYFCVGTFYLVAVPGALEQPPLAPFLLPALGLATLGYLCFLVGYGWSFRNTAPSPLGRFVPTNMLVCIIPAWIGGLGLSVARLQEVRHANYQGISSSLSFLQQFGSLFFFGWFMAWYMIWAKRVSRPTAVLALIPLVAAASVVLYFTLGSKSMAVTVLAMPAMAYYEVKRKLPLKSAVAIVLIFLFVIFPMYNTFRRSDRDLNVSRRLDQTVSMAKTWDSGAYMDVSVFAFLERITIVTSVAAVISDTGRWVDYKYGETLLLAPIGLFIPRFVWPDKPNISIGREFGETFRFTNAMDRETYIAPSMVGELYWNFALPGVIVGMWLLGMGYRWYYERYGAGTGFDPIRKAIYVSLLPIAIVFDGNVAMLVGGFIKALVILFVFVLVSRRIGWLQYKSDT